MGKQVKDDISMMQLDRLKSSRAARVLEPFPISDDEMCRRYEAVFTAAVNDVLREHTLLDQCLPTTIMPLEKTMKVAGIAFTVKGNKDLDLRNDMAERVQMLEALHVNSVVVWDTSGDDGSAQWGEVMTMAARRQKCRGAVVDGGVRDTDRVLSQNFPVFCRYRSSSGMLGRFRISGWQLPVKIGTVTIWPGDVVFGDIDGVIVVPRALAFEVLVRAEEIRDQEGQLKKWVREGLGARDILDRGGYF
jgi:4-hydroxy-4-methyl-2-oxoglutarate aldolase